MIHHFNNRKKTQVFFEWILPENEGFLGGGFGGVAAGSWCLWGWWFLSDCDEVEDEEEEEDVELME